MRVHLWGELGFYGRERRARFEVHLAGETSLADIVRLIGVPEAEIAVVGVNGEVVCLGDPQLTVTDADRLDLFPPTAGGRGGPGRVCRPRGVAADRRGA